MTNQEVFDQAARHIMQQGPAFEADECRYRATDGKKCAVGYFIPDDRYHDSFEGKVVTDEVITSLVTDLGFDVGLMAALQSAHDNAAFALDASDETFDARYAIEMRRVANRFGLDASVLAG